MSAQIDHPAKMEMKEVLIDGEDLIGMFISIEIFENIFIGGVTGTISIMDNDGVSFIESQELEFNEEISFTFVSATGVEYKFDGVMNGLRNEVATEQVKVYAIDFTSNAVRQNEMTFVNKSFEQITPEEITREMVEEKLESTLILGKNPSQGEPLTFVAGNRKPVDVIRYVLNHGISNDGNPQYQQGDEGTGTSTGTSGFLCWETLDGYRFSSMNNLFEDDNFAPTHENFANYQANTDADMEIKSKTIMGYDFPKVGDYFEKTRSGAVKSELVSFDLDTGVLNVFQYEAQQGDVTDKLKSTIKQSTRTLVRNFTNEKYKNSCEREQVDTGDQSRRYLSQTVSRQNTFSDTHGRIVLAAQYDIRAGDKIELKIYKIQYEGTDKEPQSKHSGKYLVSQVGHHFFRDGYSYTKLALIRDNNKQNQGEAE